MAISCPRCATQLPDDANYCFKCGQPQRNDVIAQSPPALQPPLRWEYKDLVVKVDIPADKPALADAVILKALQDAAKDGWQADEPTDIKSLDARNHVDRYFPGLFGMVRYKNATIRLKRLVQ